MQAVALSDSATIDFMAKVVALTPANCDQAYMPLIVHQVPQIPDRSTAISRAMRKSV